MSRFAELDEMARTEGWVQRIRNGDDSAFTGLVNATYSFVDGTARRYTSSAELAEDVAQDVFANIWAKRAELNVRDSVSGYLFSAARNHALNTIERENAASRRIDALADDYDSGVQVDVSAELEAQDLEAAITKIVSTLPPRCREIFEIRRVEGLSYKEIATLLGIAENTVYAQMGRALAALNKGLKHLNRET